MALACVDWVTSLALEAADDEDVLCRTIMERERNVNGPWREKSVRYMGALRVM